jgi:AbiV family abortive infection protein
MTPLSPEQAEVARVHILENSISLLEEARLLYAHKYFARSYTLAHLASEEVVKIPMIVRAVIDDMAGIQFDWERLEKRLRSHRKKIDAGHFHDYLQTDVRADDSDVRAYEVALETTKYINDDKNNSIYCGFTDGEAVSPLEHISESMARSMIEVSGRRVEWVKNQEEATRGMLSRGLSEEYLARYRKMREIMSANKSG